MIPSPTTARGLLGQFLRVMDPSAVNQRAIPVPVWLPTYLSLLSILAAMAGGGGARGGAGEHKSLRDGGGGARGTGGGSIYRRVANQDTAGVAKGETEAAATMA